MKNILSLVIAAVLMSGCGEPEVKKISDYADCLSCHKGIEQISANHDSDCASCHVLPEHRSRKPLEGHEKIIRNPSDPLHVNTFCLPCHQREIEQVENSLHATMAGIINQTRYLWGAQETASPAIYGLSGPFLPLPEPDLSVYPEAPRMLVDDLLRRRCLRCHIHTSGQQAEGLYRASGCAACHMLYGDDGLYRGNDQAIDHSKGGYPVRHEFSKIIPNSQCLHCHNQNRAGSDFEGLFEHDYSSSYRSPLIEGKPGPLIYGLDHHHLSKDIHAEKGLMCIDCHARGDVMGDGTAYSHEMEVPKRSCPDCHGGYVSPIPDTSNPAIVRMTTSTAFPHLPSIPRETGEGSHEKSEFFFVSKDRGHRQKLSLFSNSSVAHSIPDHKRVRCSACHAQWSFQDYGLSLIREDVVEGYKWYYLTVQGEPYLEKVLKESLKTYDRTFPITRDWVSGDLRSGIWSAGWRFRRWELMPLGVDQKDRIAILRPHYQYLISYVDRLGNVALDSVAPSRGNGGGRGWAFMPYVPHTIAPFGRACDSCHRNRVAAGLGIQKELTVDTKLTVPARPSIQTMRLLNAEERKRLLEPSKKWYKERLRALEGLPREAGRQ